jgi:cytochrome c-type protein NapC
VIVAEYNANLGPDAALTIEYDQGHRWDGTDHYGASLQADQLDWLPASHYQNRRVPREAACYACHTDYTMFGDVSAKLRGARHVWVHYFGDVPPPGEIELYVPYQNRECLHCHGGARAFEESILHADMLAELEGGEVSCLDCHGEVHHVGDDR